MVKNTYGYKANITAGNIKEIILCVKKEVMSCQRNITWQKSQADEYLKRYKDLKKRLPRLEELLLELTQKTSSEEKHGN